MRSVLGRHERVLGVGITWKILENYRVGKRLSTGVHGPGAWRRAGTRRPGKCRQRLAGKLGRDLNVSPWRSLLGLSAAIQSGVDLCQVDPRYCLGRGSRFLGWRTGPTAASDRSHRSDQT